MAVHFHQIRVKNIIEETDSCVSIELEIPEKLRDQFQYNAGQYVTFRQKLNGEDIRRSYSLCSAPYEGIWKVAVKKVPGGRFSSFANEKLKAGDILDVMVPLGNFTSECDEKKARNYVGFAAGSGITPVISLIKEILNTEKGSSFTLFYGNKTSNDIIFKEELADLKNVYLERFRLFHVLSREMDSSELFSGRMDKEKLHAYSERLFDIHDTDDFFLCGPEEMIFSLKNALEEKGVDPKKIHFELFTTPDSPKLAVPKKKRDTSYTEGDVSEVTVKLDDNTFSFPLEYDGLSILDMALSKGADLPFACKGGVCSTCKAKLIEGDIEMDINYALEPDELDRGFILTCQAHPRSDKIFVDYDHN